ncbi:MAG: transporter substrate-binding domain-containing protein [Clostridia bacterium]|nr:transporter substrate-binding domain-containing protein [Clostridia bacterium]
MKKLISILLAAVMLLSVALTVASCSGKEIYLGVQSGTTGQYYVDGDEDWGFDGIKGYASKGYSNGGLAVADMKNGAVKYVVIDEQPAKQLAQKVAGIKVIDVALTEEEYAFGVDKNQPELLASINAILAEMKTSGALDAIVAAYATGDGIKPFTSGVKDPAKADKQLVVATNAAFAPFEYKDGDKFAGIDMEIAAYIAEKLGMELVIEDMEFDSVVSSVGKNNVDVAMAGLTVNETRKEFVNFTSSYYNAAQMLVVPADNTDFNACKTAEDVLAVLAEQAK